jgi:hypothetical protein
MVGMPWALGGAWAWGCLGLGRLQRPGRVRSPRAALQMRRAWRTQQEAALGASRCSPHATPAPLLLLLTTTTLPPQSAGKEVIANILGLAADHPDVGTIWLQVRA